MIWTSRIAQSNPFLEKPTHLQKTHKPKKTPPLPQKTEKKKDWRSSPSFSIQNVMNEWPKRSPVLCRHLSGPSECLSLQLNAYAILPQSTQTLPLFFASVFLLLYSLLCLSPRLLPPLPPNSSLHTFYHTCPSKSSKNTYLVLFIEKTFLYIQTPSSLKRNLKNKKIAPFFLKNKISTPSVSATYTLTGLAPLTLTSLLANLNSAWLLERFASPCANASLTSLGGLS